MTHGQPAPTVLSVTGGAHDPDVRRAAELRADLAEGRELAGVLDAAGDRLRGWAAQTARALVDADLLASAPLAPLSFAEAEAALAEAATGPGGAWASSLGWEVDALLVEAAVAALEAADQWADAGLAAFDYALGRLVGTALGHLALPATAAAVGVAPSATLLWWLLPDDATRSLGAGVAGAADRLARRLGRHPGLEQHLLAHAGGLLDGLADGAWPAPGGPPFLPPFHVSTAAAAATLAGLYGAAGPPRLTPHAGPAPVTPRELTDLVRNLSAVNGTDLSPEPDGAIAIQELLGDDGRVRYVVYLPGTDDAAPWHHDSTARDLAADLRLAAGDDTTYGAGIRGAMREAGIGPRDPVLVVGHSLGGMEGLALAAPGSGFAVTHVVTLGSPAPPLDTAPGVEVLSLVHRTDPVPLIGGAAEPTAQHVTVVFDDPGSSAPVHDLAHYVRGAEAVTASGQPDLAAGSVSMRGYLHGVTTAHQGFVVSR